MKWAFLRRRTRRVTDPGRTDIQRGVRSEESGADEGGLRAGQAALVRVRMRRRLIGAAALLLGTAVLVPMILDPAPRPLPDNIPIDIPSERTAFAPRLSLPAAAPASAPTSAPGAAAGKPEPADEPPPSTPGAPAGARPAAAPGAGAPRGHAGPCGPAPNSPARLGQAGPFDAGTAAVRTTIAAILIVLACILVAHLVGRLLRAAMTAVQLGGPDRVLGALFGIARAVAIWLLVAAVVIHFGLAQRPFWKSSRLAPLLEAALGLIAPEFAPSTHRPMAAPGV